MVEQKQKQKESIGISGHKYIYKYKYKDQDRWRVKLPNKLYTCSHFSLEDAVAFRNHYLTINKLQLQNLRAAPIEL